MRWRKRKLLDAAKDFGNIFWARSDRDWILDGATVHVSMVGFDEGTELIKTLNDEVVESINSDLTSGPDLTKAYRLRENEGLCYMGDPKEGSVDIPGTLAATMLAAPLDPNSRSNSDVVKPWVNASDIGGRVRGMWIVDFGTMTREEAALYKRRSEYVREAP